MAPAVLLQDGLDSINYNAFKDDYDKFISANSTNSEYDATEYPIFFLLKLLNDLI